MRAATLLTIGLALAAATVPLRLHCAQSPASESEHAAGQAPSQTSTSPGSTPSQTSGSQPAQAAAPAKTSPSSPPAHRKKRRKTAQPTPQKVVVKNGSDPDPAVQFSTTGSGAQASKERQNTDGMLADTDSNLQKLSGQQLNSDQKDMVTQARSYVKQARTAEEAGDLQSAYNLALKANLLSKELVRQ